MKKKLITLFLLCSLIVPVGMTGCLDEVDCEPTQETTEAAVTFFSTNLPPKAADMPRKKMASEKANSISLTEQPTSVAMSPFRSDQQ